MAVSTWLLLVVLEGFCIWTLQASDDSEVVVAHDGEVKACTSMVRRHAAPPGELFEVEELRAHRQLYGVINERARAEKVRLGTAYTTSSNNAPTYSPPTWAPHTSMPAMPTCVADVSQDMGLSDYGSMTHSCSACTKNCTEKNSQKAIGTTWLVEPALSSCNAFDVKFFANWAIMDQLGCADCAGKGIRHKLEFEVGSNAGDSAQPSQELSFKGWMGPEILGGPNGGATFTGTHVIEVADTLEPQASDNCNAVNPGGRWYAMPGGLKAGENFRCERVCKTAHCHCGRKSHMRCEASMAMQAGQVFAYRIRKIAESASGTLDGKSYTGSEWEITATDLESTPNHVMVVGRMILSGNAGLYGIKSLSQSHEHIGCVPCDLFYESTIISGPFIDDPPGAHAVRSADGKVPDLTTESCELFRISSMEGYAVRFETGPGLWPANNGHDTLFTCSHTAQNTCPA